MTRIAILMILASSSWCSAATLDPQAREPYRWRILLRMPKHPQFNAAFREKLTRELKATLQPNLGPLAEVEIIDTSTSTDTMAKEFYQKGWAALEAPRPLDNLKQHGLTIEARDGSYQLAARQSDGFTGLLSPLLRTRTVRTLDMIPRAAALLLEPDFGIGGTVERSGTDKQLVTLTLRGHELAPLRDRVKLGDIFAVATIQEKIEKGTATMSASPVAYTFLKVTESVRDGKCQCLVLTRFENAFGRNADKAAGIRALKLAVIEAPVKVRLVDRGGKPHVNGSRLTLIATDVDFDAKPVGGEGFEWRDGLHRSTRPFQGIACVSVGVVGEAPQRFPVPVVSEDAIITLAFDVDAKAERRADFLRDCVDLRARIADLNLDQVAMVSVLNGMIDNGRNREALTRAEAGATTFAGKEKLLTEELKTIKLQDGVKDGQAKEVLEAGDRGLAVIREGQKQLAETIARLKEFTKPGAIAGAAEKEFRVLELKNQITTMIERGDVPEALAILDKLIAEFPANQSFKDEKEKINAMWAPKDSNHSAARNVWRQLASAKSPDEIMEACKAIRKAVPVLKAYKDKLGLLKFNSTFDLPTVELGKLKEKLERSPEAPDAAELSKRLAEVTQELELCASLVNSTCADVKAAEKK